MHTQLLRMALRNVRRRSRESVLVALVVFVASSILLAQLAQRHGVESRARRVLVGALSGEYLVADSAAPPINVLTSQLDAMPLIPMRAASIPREAGVELDADPRLRFGALLSAGEKSIGLNLQAVTADHQRRLMSALELTAGRGDARDSLGIVLSDVIARVLHCQPGDTLVVLATNREGYLSDGLLVVRGIFAARGVASFITAVGFIPYETGRALVHVPPTRTMELVLMRSQPDGTTVVGDDRELARLESAARRLSLGTVRRASASSVAVTPWRRTAPLFAAVIDVWRGAGIVTQVVFSALSFLLFLNVVLSKVTARRREVGTLYALGFSPARVSAMVAAEYLCVTLAGLAATALVLGATALILGGRGIPVVSEPMEAAYMGRRLYPELHAGDFAGVWLLFTTVTIVASTIPMLRFRRVAPATLVRAAT